MGQVAWNEASRIIKIVRGTLWGDKKRRKENDNITGNYKDLKDTADRLKDIINDCKADNDKDSEEMQITGD